MTELQTSLIAIGGAIVVGVVSYNKWQEWRAKKSVEKAFSPLEEDALMGVRPLRAADRHEPVLNPDDVAGAHALDHGHDHDAFIESVAKPFPLDTFIDCIIPVASARRKNLERISSAASGG